MKNSIIGILIVMNVILYASEYDMKYDIEHPPKQKQVRVCLQLSALERYVEFVNITDTTLLRDIIQYANTFFKKSKGNYTITPQEAHKMLKDVDIIKWADKNMALIMKLCRTDMFLIEKKDVPTLDLSKARKIIQGGKNQ